MCCHSVGQVLLLVTVRARALGRKVTHAGGRSTLVLSVDTRCALVGQSAICTRQKYSRDVAVGLMGVSY